MIETASQRADRTAAARAALQRKFLDQAGGDRLEAERRQQRRSPARVNHEKSPSRLRES